MLRPNEDAAFEMLKNYPMGLSITQLATKTGYTTTEMTMAISQLTIKGMIGTVDNVELHMQMRYTVRANQGQIGTEKGTI